MSLKKIWDNYGLGAFVLLVVVAYVANMLLNYLNSKGAYGFEGNSAMQGVHKDMNSASSVMPSNPDGNETFGSADGLSSSQSSVPTCDTHQNPADLLPLDNNKQWSDLNPAGKGELSNLNLLNAGHHIGTLSQSLRNPNLQIRSEPSNPQMSVGPWNNTTMDTATQSNGIMEL